MASSSTSLHPTVKFAQRSDSLFVTIELMDVKKESAVIELGPKSLVFKGKSAKKDYEVKLDLFGEIEDKNPDTKYAIKPREVSFYLKKKEEGYWPRLLSDKAKQKAHVKIDFDRWKDEDEEDETPMNTSGMEGLGGGGGFDFAKMQQMMGGMGGMGGMPGMGGMGGMPGMGEMGDFGGDDDDEGEEGEEGEGEEESKGEEMPPLA